MKQSDQYNSPKGVANNAAQKRAAAMVSPIAKKAVSHVAVPVAPSTKKSTDKG